MSPAEGPLDLTQASLAETLGIGQDGVSRLEKRSDLLISTLRGYIEAMGGRLELTAEFPSRPAVSLSGLSSMSEGSSRKRRSVCAYRLRTIQLSPTRVERRCLSTRTEPSDLSGEFHHLDRRFGFLRRVVEDVTSGKHVESVVSVSERAR